MYVGAKPTTGDFKKLDSITTSSATTFNLRQGGVAVYPQSSSHCLVVLNGILQTGGTSFNIVNDTIVFSESLSSSDVINQILVLGNVNDIGTVSDDTVSTAKLQANAVTNAKMADDAIGVAELSATGTASSSTFLRGDNAWATAGGNNTPAFFVRNSANQDVSHGSETLVTWGTEILDTDNVFASNKFTPQEAGKYFIAFQLGGADDSNTSSNLAYLMLKIRKNGSGYQSQGIFNLNNNQGRQATYSIQAIVDLNGSSDYVDFAAEVGTTDSSTARFMDDYARASGFKLIGA